MRLWSISPSYLDRMGLLGVWREGLLAQKVLAGETEGYTHHPQLIRFQTQKDPLLCIGSYLSHIADEADRRGYQFDRTKILTPGDRDPIPITRGQLAFEFSHVLKKIKERDPDRYHELKSIPHPQPHPGFRAIPGEIAPWEKGAPSPASDPSSP